MKKLSILVLFILPLCIFTLFGCGDRVELPDGMPTLEQAVLYSDAQITETIAGFTEKQLHKYWGKPTTSLPQFGDVWVVNADTKAQVVVQYERQNGQRVVVMAVTGRSELVQSFKYTYRGEGYGGKFVITLNGDGTFSYIEGDASDYVGTGTWTNDANGFVCLREKADSKGFSRTNYFTAFANLLIWVEENSDNFKYVKVSSGNIFSMDS